MPSQTLYRPGQRAPAPDIYEIVNESGIPIGQVRAIEDGSIFPPVPNPGEQYRLKKGTSFIYQRSLESGDRRDYIHVRSCH
jgi:hypothetical protein